MGLTNYVSASKKLAQELKESLTPEDIDALREECAALGLQEWINWVYANFGQVLSYIKATPLVRSKKKEWSDPSVRRKLTLASFLHVSGAQILLEVLSEFDLTPGRSYRDMAVVAGDAYDKLLFEYESPSEWPFDGRNPFVS